MATSLDRLIEAEFEQRSVLCPCKMGVVEKAKEKATGRTVAIKQVTSFSKQTIRELRLHRSLQHENILTPERVLLEEGPKGLTLAKVTQLMDSDLSRLIAEGTLRDEHCIFLLYQLLRGLKFLHSSSVAHRSLSPRHILVNSNCDLKLSHLETACLLEWAKVPTRLPETQSDRWYLSPERLLGEAGGGTEDDMWAVGCIFGEMLFQKSLFAGETASEQLSLILALIPGPDARSLSHFGSVFTIESLKQMSKSEHCSSLLGKIDPLARSLLMGLLKFSAEERLTVTEALEHEYLSDFHDYEDEPTGELLSLSSFSFETVRLTSSDIATLLADEVRLFSAI